MMGALRMGQQRKKVKIHFIGCWKSRIISMHLFHPMVEVEIEILKTNGPS
jgi:hypothetical protein